MTEIFTAKTVEEAKELAAKKFGKKASEIEFEIIEEGKKGFLGIGKVDAKVKATYAETVANTESVDNKPAEQKTEVIEPEKKIEEKAEEDPAVVAADEKNDEKKSAESLSAEKTEKAEKKEKTEKTEKSEKTVTEKTEKSIEEPDEYSIENYEPVEDLNLLNKKVITARDYIDNILRAMGITAEYKYYQNETGAIIEIDSSNNGTIIGRRGDTLDAIQYLSSIIANKGDKEYFRITIDCYGYRKKRKETLEQLAEKVAKSVLRSGRSQPLEPMNPYERRVIHSAISGIDGVYSHSVGEEPFRKIVISPSNSRKNGGRGGKNRGDRKNSNARSGRPKNRESYEPKDIDLSTSFEKDYKKPKPEDDIAGGLYGKIEF